MILLFYKIAYINFWFDVFRAKAVLAQEDKARKEEKARKDEENRRAEVERQVMLWFLLPSVFLRLLIESYFKDRLAAEAAADRAAEMERKNEEARFVFWLIIKPLHELNLKLLNPKYS